MAEYCDQDIYGNIIVNDHDLEYLHNVLDSACLAAFTNSDLRIGSLVLPIPPNDNGKSSLIHNLQIFHLPKVIGTSLFIGS